MRKITQGELTQLSKKHRLYFKGRKYSERLDLSELDLSGMDLKRLNLEDVILFETNLAYTDLSNANLSNADLRYADLRNAKLIRTKLDNAKLINANLSNSVLKYANLSNSDLSMCNLRFTDLSNANMINTNLSNANLQYTNLNSADLSNASLAYTDLNNTNMTNTNLENTVGLPYISITKNGITFNKTSIVKLGCPSYVVLMMNEQEKQIAVQSCTEFNKNATSFFKQDSNGLISVRWFNKDLLNTLCKLMQWDIDKFIYQVNGNYLSNENAIIFDLKTYISKNNERRKKHNNRCYVS